MALDVTFRFRCAKSFVNRLNKIAAAKGDDASEIVRNRLEKYLREEERKVAERERLRKKAA